MAKRIGKKPDVPCTVCGKLLYTSPGSLPPDRRMCQPCRRLRPEYQDRARRWEIKVVNCTRCRTPYIKTRGNQRLCPRCRATRKNHARPKPPIERSITGRPRTRATTQVRATQPDCHLCGIGPIDLTLDRQRHPLASCVDELVPRSQGGSPLDPANLRHAHRVCNGSRGTQPITPEVRARCRELVMHHIQRTRNTISTW